MLFRSFLGQGDVELIELIPRQIKEDQRKNVAFEKDDRLDGATVERRWGWR